MAKRYHDKMENKAGMIRSEKNEFANMPQEVKHKSYPKSNYGVDCHYRDNIEGIDAYSRENHKTVMKQKRSASEAS